MERRRVSFWAGTPPDLRASFLPNIGALICEAKLIWPIITASLFRTKFKDLWNHVISSLSNFTLVILASLLFQKIPKKPHSRFCGRYFLRLEHLPQCPMADVLLPSSIWSNVVSISLFDTLIRWQLFHQLLYASI